MQLWYMEAASPRERAPAIHDTSLTRYVRDLMGRQDAPRVDGRLLG